MGLAARAGFARHSDDGEDVEYHHFKWEHACVSQTLANETLLTP